MKQNSISLKILLPVVLLVILLSWGMYFADLSPLFSLIGFRIYIPFLPLLYIIYLRFKAGENFKFTPIPWKTVVTIFAGNLLIAVAGWYLGLLKFRLPEFHFELAASSLVDFPVYFIWTFPFFALIWFGFFTRSSSVWPRFVSSLILLLAFSPQIYAETLTLKNASGAIPLIAFALGIISISTLSKSMLHFALITFTTLWVVLFTYGTDHQLLLNTFLAYRYESWDGFFKPKNEIINYFRAGSVFFALLVSALVYKRVK